MKTASTVAALALLSLAMPVAAECGPDHAAASASASPPAPLAATQAPAATKAPPTAALKAPAAKAVAKQGADKNKDAAPDAKVAVVSIK